MYTFSWSPGDFRKQRWDQPCCSWCSCRLIRGYKVPSLCDDAASRDMTQCGFPPDRYIQHYRGWDRKGKQEMEKTFRRNKKRGSKQHTHFEGRNTACHDSRKGGQKLLQNAAGLQRDFCDNKKKSRRQRKKWKTKKRDKKEEKEEQVSEWIMR